VIRRARHRGGLPVLAAALLAASLAAAGEVVQIVDEDGTVHLTNEPCHPRYVRLAPALCPVLAAPAGGAPATDLDRHVEQTAARHGVDAGLVRAVIRVESAGDPRAVSPKGALGLMQLMPAQAARLGVRDALDPFANVAGGVRHLADLLRRYDGNVRLALAAYNAGEEAVRQHGGVPPYPETQAYVRKILALSPAAEAAAWPRSPSRGARPSGAER
jgi:soluble lytic murein transglycosylase